MHETPFFPAGGYVASQGPVLSLEQERIISNETANKLREAARKFHASPNPRTDVEVKPSAKDAMTSALKDIARDMIERVVWDGLLGKFPFMLDAQPPRLVIIESPFGHPTKVGMEANAAYGRKCMLDSLRRGEAPYASHLLYTQCLDDLDVKERKQGMEAGFAWGAVADHVAVYTDRGISKGMLEGIRRHQANNLTIEFRSIGNVA